MSRSVTSSYLNFSAGAVLSIGAVLAFVSVDQMVPRVAVVCGVAILCFATRLLPEVLTALLCFLAFLALGAAPPEVIFSGFTTGGFWLLFSGLIIGTAITQSGLGQQIAQRIFAKTGTSYKRAVALLCVSGLALGLVVPSTIPRVIVLMPVAVSLAATMGFSIGSRGQIGLAIAAATSTLLPTYAILTANLPTIVQYGALETLYGIEPSYGRYFVAQLPVNLVRFALLLLLLLPFARSDLREPQSALPELCKPMTRQQKRLLMLLGIAILFWATDSMHGISPAWVALSVASFVLWPGSGLLAKDSMKTAVDLSPAIFLVGIFAVSAVAQHVGLDALVAEYMIPRLALAEGSGLHNLYAITGFSVVISHLTTAPAAPIVLAPLAGAIAEAAHWQVHTVAMAQIIGISTPLLPYQAPPLIVAMALAHISVPALIRICLGLALGVLVIGLPHTYVWWQVIGLY
ncbi:MAG: anion permease [Rhodobacteraceae bacterium]|nr:anion permease [Paracoccaceae bacterium]